MFVQEKYITDLSKSDNISTQIYAVLLKQVSTPAGFGADDCRSAGLRLSGLGDVSPGSTIACYRLGVVLILFIFCMLFFAFFEQAGSSINNFTDRNVERVFSNKDTKTITASDVGKIIKLEPTQNQLGYHNGERLFTLDVLTKLREENKDTLDFTIDWKVAKDDVGMNISRRTDEISHQRISGGQPDLHPAFRPRVLGHLDVPRHPRPRTEHALQIRSRAAAIGAWFRRTWYGARTADTRGMVGVEWLLLAYLLHTTGELCLSPVGLSMITKLSPAHLVSTVMGGWFLTTAIARSLQA